MVSKATISLIKFDSSKFSCIINLKKIRSLIQKIFLSPGWFLNILHFLKCTCVCNLIKKQKGLQTCNFSIFCKPSSLLDKTKCGNLLIIKGLCKIVSQKARNAMRFSQFLRIIRKIFTFSCVNSGVQITTSNVLHGPYIEFISTLQYF